MKFYLLLFERDPTKSYKTFHAQLTAHPKISTWFHYLTNAYMLGTDMDESALAELVQKLLASQSLPLFFLVVAADLSRLAGFLPKAAWKWLSENAIKADLQKVEQAVSKRPENEEVELEFPIAVASKTSAQINFTLFDPAAAKRLRDTMGIDLETLERLSKHADPSGLEKAQHSWKIVQENVVKMAEVLGFKPVESADSILKQAVYFLTFRIQSQRVMAAAYGLAAALQKLDAADDIEAAHVQRFVTNCMATIAELRLLLDRETERSNSAVKSVEG